jgi:ABC-type Fe3+ transport system permease subunit
MACVVAIIVVSRRIVRNAKTRSTVGKDDSERQPVKAIWFVVNASVMLLACGKVMCR